MKVTRKQIRKLISEAFAVPDSRRGWLGAGFGKSTNNYDPYRRYRLNEEDGISEEPIEDAWAGGDNLVDPVDNLKSNPSEENVQEPEVLDLTTERKVRKIVRTILRRVMK